MNKFKEVNKQNISNKINEETIIKYTFKNKRKELMQISFSVEQIEGAIPNFYKQLNQNFKKEEEWKIISREIV
jgi:hypothetical protein